MELVGLFLFIINYFKYHLIIMYHTCLLVILDMEHNLLTYVTYDL